MWMTHLWCGHLGLQDFFMFIDSLRPSTQFTIEVKMNSMILFLDVLIHWKGLVTGVHRKLTLATASTNILIICCM